MADKMRARWLLMCGMAIAASLNGCSRGGDDLPPEQEEAVVRLHADILVLDQRASLTNADSSAKEKGIDSLYGRSGISKSSYEAAIANYRSDPESWKAFNLKIINRLEELQRARSLPKDTAKPLEKL